MTVEDVAQEIIESIFHHYPQFEANYIAVRDKSTKEKFELNSAKGAIWLIKLLLEIDRIK